MKNWKTTLFGGTTGAPILIEGLVNHDYSKAMLGLGLILVGFFSKDATAQ